MDKPMTTNGDDDDDDGDDVDDDDDDDSNENDIHPTNRNANNVPAYIRSTASMFDGIQTRGKQKIHNTKAVRLSGIRHSHSHTARQKRDFIERSCGDAHSKASGVFM